MAKRKFNIVLIGSGNVATHMGLALKKSGHSIEQVYSRTGASARALAVKLRSQAVTDVNRLTNKADIYIISVKDDALASLLKHLKKKKTLVVHTSGSLPMNILKGISPFYGVIYPLQTLSKGKMTDFANVPLCIEANKKSQEKKLVLLAKTISRQVQVVSSEKRKALHLAAVFAGNFSNHMYTLADRLLRKHKLSFNLLLPLIQETSDKIKNNSPVLMQTGPAIRGDKTIMRTHLAMLSKNKDLQKLYKSISDSIVKNK